MIGAHDLRRRHNFAPSIEKMREEIVSHVGAEVEKVKPRFRGALVHKGGGLPQIIEVAIPGIVPITFHTVVYDSDGFWNAQRQRFVIPAGVSWVRLSAQVVWSTPPVAPVGNSHVRQIVIKKNFVSLNDWYVDRPGWAVGQVFGHSGTTNDVQAHGPVLPVVAGDNFLVDAFHSSAGTTQEISAGNGTWFSIEAIA